MNAARAFLLAFVVGLACSACCTSDRCVAITTANLMHDAGDAGAEAIRHGCTERYASAKSLEEIAEIDKPCLPAAHAYADLRRSLAVLVARLAAGDSVVDAALAAARVAATDFADAIAKVPR